jgi:hypothetical protein
MNARHPSLAVIRPKLPGIACALAITGGWLFCASARADDSAPTTGPGSWQSHKYSFQFMGFTSTYSCDGLADKLKKLLLATGARADAKSQPGACASGFGRPDKFARGNVPSTPKPVNGAWRTVTFSADSPPDLHIGDCELVEQFRSQVLPMFTTRNVVSNTTCIPYQDSGSVIDLKFEVFAPAPTPPAPKP